MKARTKKTRWLLIALLFGLLAAAGLTLTLRHGAPILAKATVAPGPVHTALQPNTALTASIGEGQTLTTPPGAHGHWAVDAYSDSQPPVANNHSGSHSDTGAGTSSNSGSADSAADPIPGARPQSNHPATSDTGHLPQNGGAGDFAYNGNAPLDCELPAGCGNSAIISYVSRQPSGTSGVVPSLHNSQGSNTNNDSDNPQGNNDPGQVTDPPGQGATPPVASAPELDSATLAGAVTLLLGSLAILRGRRRARATG